MISAQQMHETVRTVQCCRSWASRPKSAKVRESAFQRRRGRDVDAISTDRARALVRTWVVEDQAFWVTGSVRKSDDRPWYHHERGIPSLGVSTASMATEVLRG